METGVDNTAQDISDLRPSFIGSSPLGEDLLEGQSQEQIAESLSQLIRTNQTENKLIGLDGAWGSGKSNLVKIIESKLKKTHHIFLYDAWGHQEDLQRRAFLEELTANLSNNNIVSPKIWNEKLKNLLARKRETITKTVPRLSYGVIVTFLVVIFTLIANSIADGFDKQIVKVVITSSPFFIGVLIWIIASFKLGHLLSVHEVYALYKEEDLTQETHVTISEKEPSVKEFQDWMKELSQDLIDKNLIIVFDNMDRLPPDRVRELWSSIHTFFAEESFEGIWVLIPFDRIHIAAAFHGDKEISDQFLSKSFSVIYRVAPPVLTDWQKFFDVKYREAFKNREEEELPIIRKAFDLLQDLITPRSIIAFINELVTLRLSVENDILLRYIAIFVLTKTKILEDPVDQILNLEFLQNAAPLFRDDENLPNHIAALVYHVPLASASQVTLKREIQNSMRDKNSSRFNELAKHRYFVDILEQVIADDDLDIPSSVATLEMLNDDYTKDQKVQNRISKIWDDLCERELSTPLSEQKFTTAHELLLKHSSESLQIKLARHIVKGIRNTEKFSGSAYYKTLFQLNDFIENEELKVDVISMVKEIKKPPEMFINYITASGKDYKKYKLKCDESELNNFIIEKIPEELEGLDVLSAVKDDYSFETVIEELEKVLPNKSLTAVNIEPFYKLYKAVALKKPIKAIQDNHINTLLTQIQDGSDGQYELFAMRLARMSSFPNFAGITQTMLQETDEKKAKRIAERIEQYTSYGDLLVGFVSWKQPLLKAVLRDLTFNSYGTSSMHIASVLSHYEVLHTSLDVEPEDFINRLDAWSKYAKESITADNISDIITDHEFFEHIIKIENELSSHAIQVMNEHLDSLSVEQWRDSLHNANSYLFNVTYWLLYGEHLTWVPENALTVYKDILIEFAKGEFEMNSDEGWGTYYARTHKNKLKATAKDIRDLFIAGEEITPHKFMMLAEMLKNHADMNEKSADVARIILAPVADDEHCLEFMINNEDFFIPLINDAGDDASNFKDIIRQKALEQEASNELIKFAKAIGIQNVDEAKVGDPEIDENSS